MAQKSVSTQTHSQIKLETETQKASTTTPVIKSEIASPDPDCLIIEDSSLMDAPRRATKRVSTLRLRIDDHLPMKKKLFAPKRYLKIHLGRDRYLSTSTFNGEDKVHLRIFEGDIPQKKGVTLGLRQAKNLIDCIPTLDEKVTCEWMEISADTKPESFTHLGFGLYMKVYTYNGHRFYDVRRYWRPFGEPNAVPTKTGLNLNSQEFQKLVGSVGALQSTLKELETIEPCTCDLQGNQLASLQCPECNPFDFHNW